MPLTSWQKRIKRAEELLVRHVFAREILGFYVNIVRFQGDLYERLSQAMSRPRSHAGMRRTAPSEVPELLHSFPSFLAVAEEDGPSRLGQAACDLRKAGLLGWCSLLDHFWSDSETSFTDTSAFLARAFLQPYAELVRMDGGVQSNAENKAVCPFCARRPGVGVLRPVGEAARRSLICSFCLAEWDFRRIVCPACGEENERKLPVYIASEFDYVRVEGCDSCQKYLKSVDLSKDGLADPVVDEIASAPLDVWAEEHNYRKIQPNLVGL